TGGPVIGTIKSAIKNAILDGIIHNDYDEAHALMLKVAAEHGLYPVSTAPAKTEPDKTNDNSNHD
ncbi:hypothetical protein, partial [uncultured Duncaniella sp.]